MKQRMKHIGAALLALCLFWTLIPAASAANGAEAVIDPSRSGSLDLYKYDLTNATADGVWDASYASTGIYDANGANAALDPYAVAGVEFTYLKVAEIKTFAQNGKTMLLYGFPIGAKSEAFLSALGLTEAQRVIGADTATDRYYTSDILVYALKTALASNATRVKNTLETLAHTDGTAMPATDGHGHTGARELSLGLYLVVETRVPENVVCTTDPFLVSVPMTSVDGAKWLYDITLYPKNATGKPTLEKTVRESITETGASGDYAHTATASAGDKVEYQIVSRLPSITSVASYITAYTFEDRLSKGISYNKNDVVLTFFRDAACTDEISVWRYADGKFEVAYADAADGTSTMMISMTGKGLREINTSEAVYGADTVCSGYGGCFLRITYAAVVCSDTSVVCGGDGNPNEVILTWRRTNVDFYGTLLDDAHVFAYGIDLRKQFSDEAGNFKNVAFIIRNATDGYYLRAEWDAEESAYYVTAQETEEADATRFIPAQDGRILIKGLEDDEYCITEIKTDDGYTLLKNNISIVISTAAGEHCRVCGKTLPVAAATVNGNPVTMQEDGASAGALVPLTVVNSTDFDLPQTGDSGVWMYGVFGVLLMAVAVTSLILTIRRNKK